MRASHIFALAASIPSTLAAYKGFNYGATFSDGTIKQQADYEAEFKVAQALVSGSGANAPFSSARLYTSTQGDSGSFISAYQAAINTKTTVLAGMWISGGSFQTELNNLISAINTLGQPFVDQLAGIAVGSEDVYRTTELGIASNAGPGVGPAGVADYISQTKSALAGTLAKSVPVGHVDTYNVYTNSSNSAIIPVADVIMIDAYPYYETTKDNSIDNGNATFWGDYEATAAVAQGKPIWITETGWPTVGATENLAVASVANAEIYFTEVGCHAFGSDINTWWFTLQDEQPVEPAVVFGVVGAGSPPPSTPKYSLTC